MPRFKIHFQRGTGIEPDDTGMDFPDLHHAYLEVCRAIPDTARDVLISGEDPLECSYIICDHAGARLMDVPFAEILSPSEWRKRQALRGPHKNPRSHQARDDLALAGFRRMFASVNVGCVLLTPELLVKDINQFGAQHSHVDRDAIRDTSILDVFNLAGKPKTDFASFWTLAQRGVISDLIDMPYLVLDQNGQSANGWWNARVWPIFDDDDHMIGLVEWAEPFVSPTAGGKTKVRVGLSTAL